jgi:hypothetical protein
MGIGGDMSGAHPVKRFCIADYVLALGASQIILLVDLADNEEEIPF